MKFDVTKEWCMAMARLEDGLEVGAGHVARDHEPTGKAETQNSVAAVDATQIAFGRVIQLLRRKQRWTSERLAEVARVELSEVVAIENEVTYRPGARTVSQLAHIFHVDPKAFQQLAGNTAVRDSRLREEATKFAARAGSIDKLTPEETRALEDFVTVLSAATDKKGESIS